MGAFAHLLGYTAADVDALTREDFDVLTGWIDTYVAELKRKASA